MPRFYFHVFDGTSVPDLEGTELPDVYTAQTQAIRTSGELLRDIGARFWDGTLWRMDIADERGVVLFVLRFSAEERLKGPRGAPGRPAS